MTDEELKQQFAALGELIEGVKESLEREIRNVGERVDRMGLRLDKIAAGSHYVSRLVAWSEKQDHFADDILRRVQALEEKMARMEPPE